jgi:hypothetical protein
MNLSGLCPLLGFPSATAMVVPSQSWLARDALGWTVTDLARAAGVSVGAVQRFESGTVSRPETLEAIQRALEMAGIIFIDRVRAAPACGCGRLSTPSNWSILRGFGSGRFTAMANHSQCGFERTDTKPSVPRSRPPMLHSATSYRSSSKQITSPTKHIDGGLLA